MALRPVDLDRWRDLIHRAQASPAPTVTAEIYHRRIGSLWEPALVECDDLRHYFVKGAHCGRILVTEQLVGRIGSLLQAPVAEVGLVDVPAELVHLNPGLDDFAPGIGHGSVWIKESYDNREIITYGSLENARRFARLAALYGLFCADDHQFVYENAAPHLVWSVDHSEFLPAGSQWTVDSLDAATPATFDAKIVSGAQVPRELLPDAGSTLVDLTDEAIAAAVAAPPDSWGVTFDERIALAGFVASRRDTLMALAASYIR